MFPKITIKISFTQDSGTDGKTVVDTSVGGTDISPPELVVDSAVNQIPPPLAAETEAFDIMPPSLPHSAEDPVPPPSIGEGMETDETRNKALTSGRSADIVPPPWPEDSVSRY